MTTNWFWMRSTKRQSLAVRGRGEGRKVGAAGRHLAAGALATQGLLAVLAARGVLRRGALLAGGARRLPGAHLPLLQCLHLLLPTTLTTLNHPPTSTLTFCRCTNDR